MSCESISNSGHYRRRGIGRNPELSLLTLLLFAFPIAQSHPHTPSEQHEQSTFGAEEVPGVPFVTRPVSIPEPVVQILKDEVSVKSCLSYNPLLPGHSLASWFTGSEIHLHGPGESDLVVVPIPRAHEPDYGCFHSAEGIAWFWVFRQSNGRYQLALSIFSNGLDILETRNNGYRNIQAITASGAGRSLTTMTFRFDGKSYQEYGKKAETSQ